MNEEYDEIFDYLEKNDSGWEKLIIDNKIKIKTNQITVNFSSISELLQKYSLRIIDISFSDYYGIIIGIEKTQFPK